MKKQKHHILKTKKIPNSFGGSYIRYQCPFCKTWHYRTAKYIHFTSRAKREALQKSAGLIKETPHLDFYLKHTEEVTIRQWKTVI